MAANGPSGTGWRYAVDFVLRPVTTALLALVVVGVSAYQVISGHELAGPFTDWAGIIIGVYFGGHLAQSGADRRRALDPPDAPLDTPR
jgi:hypothetical protein